MIILTIRTDKPEAEVGLFDDDEKIAYVSWQAHRELSATIHKKIKEVLRSGKKSWEDIEGLICYIGPGSFTGLRIGMTVANTTATTLGIPVAGTNGEDWLASGRSLLKQGLTNDIALPFYGRDPHVTAPKK